MVSEIATHEVGEVRKRKEMRFMDSMTDNSVKLIIEGAATMGELSPKEIETQIDSLSEKLKGLKAEIFSTRKALRFWKSRLKKLSGE